MGHKVPVPASTDRIICINSGLSVLLAALGEGEDIVGRDGNSTFPSSLRPVYVVASNSSRPNIELILEKRPDLILADNMLPDAAYEKFVSLGIPTAILKTSDPRDFEHTILTVGTLTGRYLEARRIVDDMNAEIGRISALADEAGAARGEKTKVFFENRKPYSSASAKSGSHIPLVQAGGINIAAGEPVSSPKLSVEYVMEQNPQVIVRRLSGDANSSVMADMASRISERTGLKELDAVKNDRVHILKSDLTLLLRYPVGLAYLASWFYPEYKDRIDPEGLHRRIVSDYFGPHEWETIKESFVYP
jgi:iron complex transport system substrate-binding protein